MVKLKSSFDKSWGGINENVTTVTNEILWGKLAQENVSFYPKILFPIRGGSGLHLRFSGSGFFGL
jgi:hypothetical protein